MPTISLSAIDTLVHENSLLQHPFYKRWSAGELTLDDLRTYAKEYQHFVARIPGMVEGVGARAGARELRERIEENRIEEQEHVVLWGRFAKSLGIDAAELAAHQPSLATVQAVDRIAAAADASFDAGVAVLYAIELELPAIAQTKKDGLSVFYGLTDADAHAYFDEHLGEEKHLEVWRSVAVDASAAAAAREAVAAQHAILDAVCMQRGIPCAC